MRKIDDDPDSYARADMKWLHGACPHCKGDIYMGTKARPGYKARKHMGKCLQCSRIVSVMQVPAEKCNKNGRQKA